MSLVATSAILLRAHPYSETSQILRFYTRDAGVVATMAKGVRKAGGRRGDSMATFAEGTLSYYSKDSRDLQTFKEFSLTRGRRGFARDPLLLAGGSVLGELVLQHAGQDQNPVLYQRLSAALDALESVPRNTLLPSLLREGWGLVDEMGYAPEVRVCVGCGRKLGPEEMGRFDFASGGILCGGCGEGKPGPRLGPVARGQLLDLLTGTLDQAIIRPRAHLRLLSDFITYHISGGTPLRSMEVLASLAPRDGPKDHA